MGRGRPGPLRGRGSLAIPFEDRRFDAVLCFRLLPHSVDWRVCSRTVSGKPARGRYLDYPSSRSVNVVAERLFRLEAADGAQHPAIPALSARLKSVRSSRATGIASSQRGHSFCGPWCCTEHMDRGRWRAFWRRRAAWRGLCARSDHRSWSGLIGSPTLARRGASVSLFGTPNAGFVHRRFSL